MAIVRAATGIALLSLVLAAMGAMQPTQKSAAVCSLAVAQEVSRLLAECEAKGEVWRFTPGSVAARLPQCE